MVISWPVFVGPAEVDAVRLWRLVSNFAEGRRVWTVFMNVCNEIELDILGVAIYSDYFITGRQGLFFSAKIEKTWELVSRPMGNRPTKELAEENKIMSKRSKRKDSN